MEKPTKRVLLINANNNVALSITRGLGRAGVSLDGVAIGHGGVGMYSRYLGKKFCLNHVNDLTIERLRDILTATGASYIMAMGENVLTHLNSLREMLPEGVKLLFPIQEVLQRAFDKSITLEYARQLNMDIPRTHALDRFESVKEIQKDIRYPAVLKFAQSHLHAVPPDLRFKYRYIFSGTELFECMEKYRDVGIFPLVQEYIPGNGVGMELCLYKGRIMGAFQHQRIHEYPVTGGVSVYRKSVSLDRDLLDSSVQLLSAMDWEGVAMVEFRRDPISGRTVLMEINGRFWGSLPLALKAGVNFPFLLYRSMGDETTPHPAAYKIDIKVQQLSTHFRWFTDAFFRRNALPPEGFMTRRQALREFFSAFSPKVGRDIEQLTDPLPGLKFWAVKIGLSQAY